MTREEAIKILKEHHDHWIRLYKEGICTKEEGENTIEALEMAIKALDQEPCGDAIDRAEAIKIASGYCHPANVAKELAKLPAVNPQEPTDTWSIKDVADTLEKHGLIGEQEPKTGHWEQYGNSWEDKFKCSECGKEQPKILCGEQIIGHWSDYCPNCGCRMVEPQERSDKE